MLTTEEESIKQELLRLMKHFQCPICLNLMSDLMVTRCVHHFCGQCITKAIESSSGDYCRCPLCNEKITKRSLRPQLDVEDLILKFKETVDSFEKDNGLSLITENNEVVVFDVSERNKSFESNESVDKMDESKDKKNGSESKCKTTTITPMLTDWPTCDASNDCIVDIKDLEETDIYFESTEDSINAKFVQTMDSLETNDTSVIEPNPTQSQNLRVTKSKITYSTSLPPIEDKFDRIIRLSEISLNKNEVKEKPNPSTRRPLTLMNKNNKILDQKKYKRIETLDDSSDNEISIISETVDINVSNGDQKSLNNKIASFEDKSEELFLPAINSFESNRNNDSLRDESRDGYNSDTQLITSSPVSEF